MEVCSGRLIAFNLLAFSTCIASVIAAGEKTTWPEWRGEGRDSILQGVEWPDQINEDSLRLQWQVELQPSYSGPIVTGDRVLVTETVDKKDERVRALDRQTGDELWTDRWPGSLSVPFFAMQNGSWIRATPIYDEGRLYVPGIRDFLVCLDTETGERLWEMDFVKEYDVSLPGFGCASSPLIEGDFLYIQAGAGFVKVNKRTGKPEWRVLVDEGGMHGSAFSSPVVAEINGQKQIVVQTRTELTGLSLETGKAYWSQEVPAFRGMNILTPLVQGNEVFTSTYGGKTWLYQINQGESGSQVDVVWQANQQGYMSSPILIDGYIYHHLKNQRFTCYDWKTGEQQWTTEPFGKYWSMVAAGDKILALDQKGDLLLIRANPEKFELLDKRHLTDDTTWAHLAVCDDQVFVRSLAAQMVYQWTK
ncbi:outer membrane biogenesis protein BamB [Polystyrenella longa]|uniref:Outer membrane biogenesis protein BamB n=1 Tax=Polystyrenella longa TaxID=2528007 RepID=A0A518CI97_9PLAN|nr:PQQ-binding-like beta-propeller repeat protein [Polystyrenella longa]QDU78956.1 outer membrane biogenesis protein BamB [Polystyrenella longa]